MLLAEVTYWKCLDVPYQRILLRMVLGKSLSALRQEPSEVQYKMF